MAQMVKNVHAMWETLGLIPGLGRSPGRGHGNLLQYSCLENPHGQRSLAGYSPWGCKESDMTDKLSVHRHTHGNRLKKKRYENHLISTNHTLKK